MQVFLDEIVFNHDQESATIDAFNIRRNETETVNIPEWRRLVCVKPGDSPAAYARDALTGTPTIQAKFSFAGFGPEVQKVRIRAVDLQKPAGVFQRFLFRILGPLTGVAWRPNVLGSVVEREVALADAGTLQTFQLQGVRINTAGVSVSDVIWRWQFRTETTNWTNFETSTHRIYTVLKLPTSPWQPLSTSPTVQMPWTDVLNYACTWAAMAQSIDGAASLITTAVHNLGTAGVLRYPIEYSGASGYVSDEPPRFFCTDFIKLLRRQSNNNEPGVNCDDCAAIVGSFCNIVGHDLFQSKMQSDFGLNPNKLIGLAGTRLGGIFTFHAVAWKDPCDEDSELFDACVQLDFDSDPSLTTIPPDTLFRVPRNIKFGQIGEHEYRFRLVKSAEEECCVPVPSSKKRRIIGLSELDPVAPFPDVLREFVAERYAVKTWKGTHKLGENLFVFNFFFDGNEFANWRLHDLRLINQTNSAPIIQAFLRSANAADKVNIRIDVHERRSLLDAHATVLRILSGFHLPDIVRQEHATYGDVVFSVPTNLVILFARGNLVFLLRNVGKGRASCEPLAKAIDNLIISKPRTGNHSGSLFSLESAGENNGRHLKPLFSPEENHRRQFKIFSSGVVSFEKEQLVYYSTIDEPQPLEIFAIDTVGRIEKQLLTAE